MNFYQSISENYDSIFPLNSNQTNFVKSFIADIHNSTLLDIGCGTGNLTIDLAKISEKIIGIDIDESMLQMANNKSEKVKNIEFRNCNMLEIEKHFSSVNFDSILCFGNTLVHLNSEDEILSFFKQSQKLLKSKGKLLIQIINYDRVIDLGISSLPTIENKILRFERNYKYLPNEGKINFQSILTIKNTEQVIKNSIKLLPILKSKIENLLQQVGFSRIEFYGDFKKNKHKADSIPLIISVEK